MQLINKIKPFTILFLKWYTVCLFGFIFSVICACSSSDNAISEASPIPSNLSVSSIIVGTDSNNPNGDGSGIVDFTITATNATSYKVLINNKTLELTQNTFSYTFTDSGTKDYPVIITAINSAGSRSITISITITVNLSTQLQLVWSDEFDGNGSIDTSKWAYDTGTPENNEVQIYTTDESNINIEDGVLKITAIKGGASAVKYYFDELNLLDAGGNTVSVIENFEGAAPTFNDFDGASTQVITNPSNSGENTTSKVVEFEKTAGSSANAGVFWDINSAIDLSVNNKISLKTWSPDSGVVVRLKLENSTNSAEFHLVDASTSVSSAWETLTYDFSGAPAYNYDRLVVFFDHGNTLADYTSGRITTQNLYDFTYGTVEVRAKLPAAEGTWPAIWLLGANFGTVGWPTCGEIDIMEQTGWDKNKVLGTCHWSSNGNYAGYGLDTSITNAASSFHVYKLEWTEGAIRFFLDDVEFFVMTTNNSMPFNKDFFFILNVAMGGDLGGTIDPNFAQDTMEIDYVRVYQ